MSLFPLQLNEPISKPQKSSPPMEMIVFAVSCMPSIFDSFRTEFTKSETAGNAFPEKYASMLH